jgi:hypothetical protein
MPLYPSIVLRAKERAPTPCPSVVFNLGLTFESRKELGVRQLRLELIEATTTLIEKLDVWFLEQTIYDAMGIVYP